MAGCSLGSYGDRCKSKCDGHCLENSPCNHISGRCDRGCAAGWMGKQCNLRMYISVYVIDETSLR